jgi:hypothetical protein
MSSLHPACRALQIWFGIALWAAFAIASGCAADNAAGEPEKPGAPSIGQDADALAADTTGMYACVSGATPGSLVVHVRPAEGPSCSIRSTRLLGSSHKYCIESPGCSKTCPDCNDLANGLGCQFVADAAGLVATATGKYACVSGATPKSLVVRGAPGEAPACGITRERLVDSSDLYCVKNPGCFDTCPDCRALASDTFKCVL